MFHLHDTNRRRLCVMAFLALGLLPTLAVAAWCAARHTSGSVSAEAMHLGRQFGFDVQLGGFEHTRPGVVLYKQLEATDPETKQLVFRCSHVEVSQQREVDSQGQSRPTFVITASRPEIAAASFGRVWQCLQRILEGAGGPLESNARFLTNELTLRADDNAQTLVDVQGVLEDLAVGVHTQLDFRLAGDPAANVTRLRIVRNRQVAPPLTGFELDSGDAWLPCDLLAMGFAELKSLGSRCRFRGHFHGEQAPNGWRGEIEFGQLVELDMGRLLGDRFPYKLTGQGEATIQVAKFVAGRLEEANLAVTAGPGVIDRSLITAGINCLGLATCPDTPSTGNTVRYDQLAFSARLNAAGMRITGRCTDAEPGTVLSANRTCLLGEPLRSAPTVALVRTLVPQSAIQVPASRQTDWLLSHLPIPEAAAADDTSMPHARIRVPDRWQR